VIFPSGKTSADFHNLGTSPFLIDALKMEQTGLLKLTAQLFSSQFGISSGPIALRSLMQDRRASTASGEIMHKSGIQVTGIGWKCKGGISLETR
jgi:hypothetical protein